MFRLCFTQSPVHDSISREQRGGGHHLRRLIQGLLQDNAEHWQRKGDDASADQLHLLQSAQVAQLLEEVNAAGTAALRDHQQLGIWVELVEKRKERKKKVTGSCTAINFIYFGVKELNFTRDFVLYNKILLKKNGFKWVFMVVILVRTWIYLHLSSSLRLIALFFKNIFIFFIKFKICFKILFLKLLIN